MAKDVQKIGRANPAWPEHTPTGHPVTEITASFSGAASPFGDELILPRPYEETGYVHPTTRINR